MKASASYGRPLLLFENCLFVATLFLEWPAQLYCWIRYTRKGFNIVIDAGIILVKARWKDDSIGIKTSKWPNKYIYDSCIRDRRYVPLHYYQYTVLHTGGLLANQCMVQNDKRRIYRLSVYHFLVHYTQIGRFRYYKISAVSYFLYACKVVRRFSRGLIFITHITKKLSNHWQTPDTRSFIYRTYYLRAVINSVFIYVVRFLHNASVYLLVGFYRITYLFNQDGLHLFMHS